MTLSKINKHPRDELTREHKDYATNHIYEINIDGKWTYHTKLSMESVTTFIAKFFKKFDADEVIEKYYTGWQYNSNSQYCGLSSDEIKDLWEQHRDKRAKHGTYMHYMFEQYFNWNKYDKKLQELPEFRKWVKEWGITPYRTEMTVFSEKFNIVGNIDLIYIDSKGRYNICDFKRKIDVKAPFGNDKCKPPLDLYRDCEETKNTLQLSIYKKLLEEEYRLKIHKLYNLYIFRNNPYTYRERKYIEPKDLFTIK